MEYRNKLDLLFLRVFNLCACPSVCLSCLPVPHLRLAYTYVITTASGTLLRRDGRRTLCMQLPAVRSYLPWTSAAVELLFSERGRTEYPALPQWEHGCHGRRLRPPNVRERLRAKGIATRSFGNHVVQPAW